MQELPQRFRGMPASRVSGGDINAAARVELPDGPAFLKWRSDAPAGMFAAEAHGLSLLSDAAGSHAVPQVLGQGDDFLLLEWIEPGAATAATDAQLGELLARLHGTQGPRFGLDSDNFIGVLPQPNGWCSTWAEFWWLRRIEPQLRRAVDAGAFDGAQALRVERAARRVGELCPAEAPALVHGDLWSGNVLVGHGGAPHLVDPAPAYAHREGDLAMMRLFGGFGPDVWRRYDELLPVAAGFDERCVGMQLYPLLVHVNHFGGSYVGRTLAAAARFC